LSCMRAECSEYWRSQSELAIVLPRAHLSERTQSISNEVKTEVASQSALKKLR